MRRKSKSSLRLLDDDDSIDDSDDVMKPEK